MAKLCRGSDSRSWSGRSRAVNPNHTVGGTQPHKCSRDHAQVGGGPNPRGVQMDLRGDPRVRAEVITDDEEEEEFQDLREDQPDQLLVSNLNPPPASDLGQPGPILMGHPSTSVQGGNQSIGWEGEDMVEDLVQDAKFYQDTALELQGAYKNLYQWQVELQGKYDEQSKLLKEVSAAIKAADAEAKQRHQALLYVQCNKQQEFNQAIEGAVQQYKVQLNTAQSKLQAKDWEHQLTIKQLQDKISMLEVTSTSQANLPSVATSNPQEMRSLHSQIFGYVLGTVNTKRGAAKYDGQDQVFSFSHKQVSFQDGGSSPDLDTPPMVGQGPQSSTLYCTSNAALNRTLMLVKSHLWLWQVYIRMWLL